MITRKARQEITVLNQGTNIRIPVLTTGYCITTVATTRTGRRASIRSFPVRVVRNQDISSMACG